VPSASRGCGPSSASACCRRCRRSPRPRSEPISCGPGVGGSSATQRLSPTPMMCASHPAERHFESHSCFLPWRLFHCMDTHLGGGRDTRGTAAAARRHVLFVLRGCQRSCHGSRALRSSPRRRVLGRLHHLRPPHGSARRVSALYLTMLRPRSAIETKTGRRGPPTLRFPPP
jgi:hypothetical protein